jgi:uncharacterized membrane protein
MKIRSVFTGSKNKVKILIMMMMMMMMVVIMMMMIKLRRQLNNYTKLSRKFTSKYAPHSLLRNHICSETFPGKC